MMTRIPILGIWLLPAVLVLTGCGRAPSFDILGSFFPAWLVCLALGLLLTGAVRWLSRRIRIPLALPVLTWPSLAALFTFLSWLAFFDQ
jgi:YtcA family